MTGYTVHTGTSKQFTEGWDRVFDQEPEKKTKTKSKAQAKKKTKKKKKKS
jgi:hypothetical protein